MSGPTTAGMLSQGTFGRNRAPRALGGHRQRGVVAATATLLASAPLAAIFDGWAWLFHCVMTVAVVAAAATAARALRAPVWAQALAMLGALLLAVTWQFRSGEELLGILPTTTTLEHFSLLLSDLPEQVQGNVVPAPPLPSFLLASTLGIGLIAILVDLCAVGARRPALAGLPMLAIYSVPVAILLDSVPGYTFVIGVVGYLWLLGADNLDRVRRFGRRFTGDGRGVAAWEPSPLAATGRRLAALGVAVAVIVPLAIPGVSSGLVDRFSSSFPGASGTGGPGATSVNLFATLDGLLNRDERVEMLQVEVDDANPHYLRIGVADEITADGFDHRPARGSPVTGGVPVPPGLGQAGVTLHEQEATVQVLPGFSMPRLPTYPALRSISGLDGQWRYDLDQQVVYSAATDSAGQEYSFSYARTEFGPDALRRAAPLAPGHGLQQFATIPEELREPEVTDLVEDLTQDADNPYDQVRAILGYFSTANGFTYSLETGDATTGSAIVDFLLHNKRGYCVQYAAAMAWMVRELGLPARVAIGFTSGSNRATGTFTLTNHNAHAWPEVYFQGFGWVPFEPTPSSSVAGSVSPDWAPDPNAPEDTEPDQSGSVGDSSTPEPAVPPEEQPPFLDEGAQVGGGAPTETGSRVGWWILAGAVLLLALLLAPALSRAWLRRRRLRGAGQATGPAGGGVAATPATDAGPGPGVMTVAAGTAPAIREAHAAWDELLDTMTDFRVPLDPAETPRATAARLVQHRGGLGDRAGDSVRLLRQAEERARYAPTPLPPTGLVTSLRTVRRALARGTGRGTRLRAAVLPPSTLLRWRHRVAAAATGTATTMNRWGEALARLSPRRLLRSS